MIFLFKQLMFRFHVSFRGCMLCYQYHLEFGPVSSLAKASFLKNLQIWQVDLLALYKPPVNKRCTNGRPLFPTTKNHAPSPPPKKILVTQINHDFIVKDLIQKVKKLLDLPNLHKLTAIAPTTCKHIHIYNIYIYIYVYIYIYIYHDLSISISTSQLSASTHLRGCFFKTFPGALHQRTVRARQLYPRFGSVDSVASES